MTMYRKIVEQKRIFKFLLRLNKKLDEVREHIMSIEPLPNIKEVFFEVQRKESKWDLHCLKDLKAKQLTLHCLRVLHLQSKIPTMTINNKEGSSVIITVNLDIQEKLVRRSIENQPIGSQNVIRKSCHNVVSLVEEKPSNETSEFSKEQMEILQKMISQSLSQSAY